MGFALFPREGQTESTGEKVTSPWHSGTGPCPCGPVVAFRVSVRFGDWDYLGLWFPLIVLQVGWWTEVGPGRDSGGPVPRTVPLGYQPPPLPPSHELSSHSPQSLWTLPEAWHGGCTTGPRDSQSRPHRVKIKTL